MTVVAETHSRRWLPGHLFSFNPWLRFVRFSALAARAALTLFIASDAFATSHSAPEPHHTSVLFVANVRGVVPGGRFTLGLLMTMDQGWHTY